MRLRYGKRPRLSSRDFQLLFLIGLVSIVVLGTLIGADIRLSGGLAGGGGFFAPWQAARAFLFEHASPYGGDVASQVQQQVYGRPAQSGEDPFILRMPFFLLPVYFPFAFLSDPAIARGLWLFFNQAALVGAALLTLRLIEWQPGRIFRVALALVFAFSVYSVASLLDGGPAIVLGLLYCTVLYAYFTGQDELAGALLVFTLFAWEIGLFFVILLLWKAFYDKRWRVWAGFGMLLLLLLIVSFMIYPGWIFPFATASLAGLRSAFGTDSAALLERLSPAYGVRASQALTVLLIILLIYEWAATRHSDERRFIWTAFLTLAVTPLIGFRLELGSLVVLLPALPLILGAVANRWRRGYWLASLLLLIVFLLPLGWFVRWYLLRDSLAFDYLLLFLPLFTAAGLYWTRWWFVRPPRTWFDHVRSTLSATQRIPTARRSPGSSG